MAKRFKTRVKRLPIKSNKEQELLREVEKSVREVNKRLKSLTKSGNLDSWASKKLINRLGGGKVNVYSRGKVRVPKKVNKTRLNAILKASKQFLASETSTTKGINTVANKTKENMFKTLKLEKDNLTKEDIETYYDMLGDKDFDFFTKSDRIGASELWANIDSAIEAGDSKGEFLKRLGRYEDINDKEIREKLANIYEKYVL